MAQPRTRVDQMVANNKIEAESWVKPLTMKQMREGGETLLMVVTCMDSRASQHDFLGSKNRVATFRNAGGRYTPDLVRSIAVLRSLVYKAKEASVAVVHHTDCGMMHVTDDSIKEDIKKRDPSSAAEADKIEFGAYKEDELEKSVREDVEKLKADPLLKGVNVYGFVLSTEEGTLREVV